MIFSLLFFTLSHSITVDVSLVSTESTVGVDYAVSTVVSTVAGLAGSASKSSFADGLGSRARFGLPQHVAFNSRGVLVIADAGSFPAIRTVSPNEKYIGSRICVSLFEWFIF